MKNEEVQEAKAVDENTSAKETEPVEKPKAKPKAKTPKKEVKTTSKKETKEEEKPKKVDVSQYKNIKTRNTRLRKQNKELEDQIQELKSKVEKLEEDQEGLIDYAKMTQEETQNIQKQVTLKNTQLEVYHETIDTLIQQISLALDSAIKIINYNSPDADFKSKKGDE